MLNKRSISGYFKQKKYGKYNKYSKCPNIYVYVYLVQKNGNVTIPWIIRRFGIYIFKLTSRVNLIVL